MAGRARARRCISRGRYGARISKSKPPGERGGQGDFIPGLGMTRDTPELPRHGLRRRASSASAAGVLAGLKSLGKKDGEGAGKETKLTTARIRSKNGLEQQASRGRRRFSGGGSV